MLPSKDRLFVPRYILIPTQRDLNTKPFVIPQESTLEAVQTRVEEANPSEKHVSNAREQPLTNKIFAKISQNNQECDKPKPNATEARKEKSPHPVVKGNLKLVVMLKIVDFCFSLFYCGELSKS